MSDELNFAKLKAQGREIDKGIANLRTKVLEPSKFGSGREAFDALKEIIKEIKQMKDLCCHEINYRQKEYETIMDFNEKVKDKLGGMHTFLDKLESQAAKYGYKTYESYCAEQQTEAAVGYNCTNVNQEYESVSDFSKKANDSLEGINNVLDKLELQAVKYSYKTYESYFAEEQCEGAIGYNCSNVSGIERLSLYDSNSTLMHFNKNRENLKQNPFSTFTSQNLDTSPITSTPKLHAKCFFSSKNTD